MGNQRRSYPNVVQGIEELKNGHHRQAILWERMVYQQPWSIGTGKENRARMAQLGALAGPGAAHGLQRQHCALQLALVLALGDG
jgi:hypothetical protein